MGYCEDTKKTTHEKVLYLKIVILRSQYQSEKLVRKMYVLSYAEIVEVVRMMKIFHPSLFSRLSR